LEKQTKEVQGTLHRRCLKLRLEEGRAAVKAGFLRDGW
jgi:hypothetical protein